MGLLTVRKIAIGAVLVVIGLPVALVVIVVGSVSFLHVVLHKRKSSVAA